MKKRVMAFLMVLVLLITAVPVCRASDLAGAEKLAGSLKQLGIFKGVSDTNFDLGRAPSRLEALVMLVRLLGKENAAVSGTWRHPFQDVPDWADKYVGYAYQNSLTNGISATEFGVGNASAGMYLTFALRALDYSDTNGLDFSWQDPFTLAHSVGILDDTVDQYNFLRSDVVRISYLSLSATLKGSSVTLAQKLIADGVFTQLQYDTYCGTQATVEQATPPPQYPQTANTAETVYAKCAPSVFYIEVLDATGAVFASGSGFFIDADGTAVTNYHVIGGCRSATITLSSSGEQRSVIGIYDHSASEDWAVIKVEGSGYTPLPLNTSAVTGGAKVYAIGSPLGLQNSITEGIISNPARYDEGIEYIQTSAAISSGSSGGALINTSGEAIGITSASYDEGNSLNLALPVKYFVNYSKGALLSLSEIDVLENPPLPPIDPAFPTYLDWPQVIDFGAVYGIRCLNIIPLEIGEIMPSSVYQYGFWDYIDAESDDEPYGTYIRYLLASGYQFKCTYWGGPDKLSLFRQYSRGSIDVSFSALTIDDQRYINVVIFDNGLLT